MKRSIQLLIILVVGFTMIGFMGVSYAATATTPPKVCPPGTKPSQDLAECAQCANAAGCVPPQSDPSAGGSCSENSCDLIKTWVDPGIALLSALVGVACVISLVTAGIQYTASAGDPQKASRAKSRIFNTIVAFLAFAFLWAFLEFLIPGGVINPGS